MPTPLWTPKEGEPYCFLSECGNIQDHIYNKKSKILDCEPLYAKQNSIAPHSQKGFEKLEAERAARELRARASVVDRSKIMYILDIKTMSIYCHDHNYFTECNPVVYGMMLSSAIFAGLASNDPRELEEKIPLVKIAYGHLLN